MTIPPARRLIVSSFLVALLVAGLVQGQVSDAPTAAFAAETLSLTPGAALEREIRGGETRTFDLMLAARAFLYLEISKRGPGISSRVLDSRERIVAEAESYEGPGSQLLALITDHADTYRLEIIATGSPKLSGSCKLLVHAVRPSAKNDEARVRGARTLAAARRLLALAEEKQSHDAEVLLAESLAAWQAAGDARGEVEALFERGSLEEDRGDAKGALVWYENALARSKEIDYAEGEARALADIGFCKSKLGYHDEAIDRLQLSLEIWRRIGGAKDQASALQRLGTAYARKNDSESGLAVFQEAASLAEAARDPVLQARALSGLGASHYYLGRPGEAREIWEKALNLSREGGDTETEVLLENNLAVLYHNQGQFQLAVELYTRLVGVASPKDAGLLRANMGTLYLEMESPEKALENYELARDAYHALGDIENEAAALVNIGRTRQRMGDPQAALAEYENARRLLPQTSWSVFNSIGLAYIDLRKPQEALPALEKALEIAKEAQDRSRQTATFLALGRACSKLGQPETAIANLKRAIAIGEEIGYNGAVAPAHLELGLLHRSQGQLEDALGDVEKALEIVESTRRNIAGDQLRIGFFAARRAYYDLQIDLLAQLDRVHPEKYRARALEASERARARGLLDLLAEGRIDLSQGLDADLRRREDDLFERISRAQRELRANNPSPERNQELRAELKKLDGERERLDQEIRSKNKRYAEVRYPSPLALAAIQNRVLDDNSALLEYVLGDNRSVLFVVTRQALTIYDLPGTENILQRVRRLRNALERESLLTRRDYLELAFQLYRDLVEPASEALAGKSSLLIVPDGALHYIPFEALLTEAARDRPFRDLPYLLRRYSISYVPSASVLAGLREPRQEPIPADRKEIAVFAPFAKPGTDVITRGSPPAPSATGAGQWNFSLLPGSQQEISRIADLYPGAALKFVGNDANEGAVTHNPGVAFARRLHFATHAQIDERYPEHSALVLAERTGEDGLLQVYEIFNLKLSADLIVLSACQTALGKEVTGEGLVGLSRAFFYTGVHSLVVSLWNVVDGPTPDLMVDFYKSLDHLKNKAKALQAAKISMVEQGDFSHPSFWAPFILLGEPQ